MTIPKTPQSPDGCGQPDQDLCCLGCGQNLNNLAARGVCGGLPDICDGCGLPEMPEMHKMCLAHGTPVYMHPEYPAWGNREAIKVLQQLTARDAELAVSKAETSVAESSANWWREAAARIGNLKTIYWKTVQQLAHVLKVEIPPGDRETILVGFVQAVQEKLSAADAELAKVREERDRLRNILDSGKGQSAISVLYAHVERLEAAAQPIVDAIRAVGDQTNWEGGDETDRVYPWYEIEPLSKALAGFAENQLTASERAEAAEAQLAQVREALGEAVKVIDDLAGQQAMPDDFYQEPLHRFQKILAATPPTPEPAGETLRYHCHACGLRYDKPFGDDPENSCPSCYYGEQLTVRDAQLTTLREAMTFAMEVCRDNLSMCQYKNELLLLEAFKKLEAALTTPPVTNPKL
jgi:hypothetical protein